VGPGAELDQAEVLETLIGLVDKSVVLRVADVGGTARYRLPAIVREQGAEHASATGDQTTAGPGGGQYLPGEHLPDERIPGERVPLWQIPAQPGPSAGPPAGGPGAAPDGPGPSGEPAAGVPVGRWDLLTAREREVAGLVAQGLTNRDIAARLVVSKRTVDAHLEHILSKLGYSSRVQVAALASRAASTDESQTRPAP
jgi:DNA-binding CsgD family transcriptional regulator